MTAHERETIRVALRELARSSERMAVHMATSAAQNRDDLVVQLTERVTTSGWLVALLEHADIDAWIEPERYRSMPPRAPPRFDEAAARAAHAERRRRT